MTLSSTKTANTRVRRSLADSTRSGNARKVRSAHISTPTKPFRGYPFFSTSSVHSQRATNTNRHLLAWHDDLPCTVFLLLHRMEFWEEGYPHQLASISRSHFPSLLYSTNFSSTISIFRLGIARHEFGKTCWLDALGFLSQGAGNLLCLLYHQKDHISDGVLSSLFLWYEKGTGGDFHSLLKDLQGITRVERPFDVVL